nr:MULTISPECIES: amidohydrolase family protein [unclassified Corynebacterium]
MQETGTLITPRGVFPNRRVEWEHGIITSIEEVPASDAPEQPRYLLPGVADLHNHGGAGASFPSDPLSACRSAALHHRAHGTSTLLASTVSLPEELLLPQLELLAQLVHEGAMVGIHAEGPFVNTLRCGAQDPAAIIPGDPALFSRMIDAAQGTLRSVTLAPETAHLGELLELCAEHGIIASFGHTDADFPTTIAAVRTAAELGVQVTATHLFNAMPPIHHRNPGAAAALLRAAGEDLAVVELVADGVHLDDHTVEFVLSTIGAGRTSFVSDAMGAAGQADGHYILGRLAVTVQDGVARLSTNDGTLGAIAGGTSHVFDQVRRHITAGLDPQAVITAATTGHRLLGLTDRGDLQVGMRADIISTSWTDTRVYYGGELQV